MKKLIKFFFLLLIVNFTLAMQCSNELIIDNFLFQNLTAPGQLFGEQTLRYSIYYIYFIFFSNNSSIKLNWKFILWLMSSISLL